MFDHNNNSIIKLEKPEKINKMPTFSETLEKLKNMQPVKPLSKDATEKKNTAPLSLKSELNEFYSNPSNLKIAKEIIKNSKKKSKSKGEKLISFRMYDFAFANLRGLITDKDGNFIKSDYEHHLGKYSKSNFDTFCRGEKLQLEDIQTTIGQLSILKFTIVKDIHTWLEKNYDLVREKMTNSNKEARKNKKEKKEKNNKKNKTYDGRNDINNSSKKQKIN